MVEADVWLYRGRLEVRHLKTLGPIPILWDRWKLASGLGPRLLLRDLIQAAAPSTELMLDLKGSAAALPGLVADTMGRLVPGRRYTVASQWWQQLDRFRPLSHVRVIHSIGSVRRYTALPRWLGAERAEAVAINRRLLTRERLAELRVLAPSVFTWTVNDPAHLDELLDWGVDGIISDDYHILGDALTAR